MITMALVEDFLVSLLTSFKSTDDYLKSTKEKLQQSHSNFQSTLLQSETKYITTCQNYGWRSRFKNSSFTASAFVHKY